MTTFTFWAVAQSILARFWIFWCLQIAKTLRISKMSLKWPNKAIQRLSSLPNPVCFFRRHPLLKNTSVWLAIYTYFMDNPYSSKFFRKKTVVRSAYLERFIKQHFFPHGESKRTWNLHLGLWTQTDNNNFFLKISQIQKALIQKFRSSAKPGTGFFRSGLFSQRNTPGEILLFFRR